MPDRIGLRIDGRSITAPGGVTVAAALADAGVAVCRASVSGEGRGVLCAMGICFECRVAVDGVAHRRACMELVRDGMVVETGARAVRGPLYAVPSGREDLECDVAVVGAGPAGVAAACRAAEGGARTIVLDEGLAPGGQIYRHLPGHEPPAGARTWVERLSRSGALVRHGAGVFDAVSGSGRVRLAAQMAQGVCRVTAGRVVLATGAREFFLPFPGWTLPGVLGAGGAQALWKSGASYAGRTAVVAGSGPLLLPVAASLARAGARVRVVAEQTSLAALARFAGGLLGFPSKLAEAAKYRRAFSGARYRTGTWIREARGAERLEGVVLTDGSRSFEVACDLAAVAYGLVPNTEMAHLLGCEVRGGVVAVDDNQQTSVPGVYCSGEPCGVGGVDVAVAEGQIAGIAAARRPGEGATEVGRLRAARRRGRRLAAAMDRAFRPREELRAVARPDTIVCRCEDVALGTLSTCRSAREAKLSSRAGMGPCQGRVCGPALGFLFGWDSDSVRPPARPAALGNLLSSEDPE